MAEFAEFALIGIAKGVIFVLAVVVAKPEYPEEATTESSRILI